MAEYQTLAEFFGVDRVDFRMADLSAGLSRTAHLVVDVQRDFVKHSKWGTYYTEDIARGIGPLTERFRKAGIRPYWVYYRELNLFGYPKPPSRAYGGFFKVRPRRGDPVIGKDAASAFEGSDIHAQLQRDGIRNLVVSGFNTSACVQATVEHALAFDYNVCIPEDMTENGAMPACASATLRALEEKGAIIADSASILSYVGKLTAA